MRNAFLKCLGSALRRTERLYTEAWSVCDSFRDGDSSSKLEDAFSSAKYLIRIYASAQSLESNTLATASSEGISVRNLRRLIEQFVSNNSLAFLEVEISSRDALNGARSSYAMDRNTIYLAEDFVARAGKNELLTALLQEVINVMDADER